MTAVIETIADLRAACDEARGAGRRVGLVPTMGYLHAGHRSLIRAARETTDFVVVTIFVNPLQFAPGEDLDRYPRDLEGDVRACEEEGADVVFAAPVAEMYPKPPKTRVSVADLTADLCGRARPTHFDGVTTVVAKLLSIVGPCTAFFGRKDAQQLAVVRRMVDDLSMPVDVVGCPLVREADGLALSSRNAYLSHDQREAATVLFESLRAAADAVAGGERDAATVAEMLRGSIAARDGVEIDYAEVRDAAEMTTLDRIEGEVLLAVAARLGETRLIDNVRLTVRGDTVTADLGTGFRPDGRE
ncbi:MAG: pantoate--beta-alanine ligase [Acidimicrobiia bacterium]|nr:pantoate--beta-alanine ligase [Acidimicrobiia bacterium]